MTTILLTCEHAAKGIPGEFNRLMNIPQDILKSHRGWDIGALSVSNRLQKVLNCSLISGEYSRLLIDLNRSPDHKNLFSEFSKILSPEIKTKIINEYYLPYREKVEYFVAENVRKHKLVIHFSLHSFTPILKAVTRKADVGILFDPERSEEVKIADQSKKMWSELSPDLIIRKNYPYRGVTDGMVSYLRKNFLPLNYIGFEIEINQNIITGDKRDFQTFQKNLAQVLTKLEFLSV